MAKDRNTIAKRQREVEKREKAARKRVKREQRKILPTEMMTQRTLSDDDHKVLSIFKRYLMTAGKMLCLNSSDISLYRSSLSDLVNDGFLVAEETNGGYSLTASGFQAMIGIRSEA